ncbi:MAG: hypothetical protein BGN88_03140 [Clostridiales bacterium 43-6]|nr:MAG: hypothetical protein BGN88_03140 [Clostridiales bacterium 43-6]
MKLEKISNIKKERLDKQNYTMSLLNEGLRAGVITEQEFYHVLAQLMQLTAEQTAKYTRGESSSVPIETASSIALSVMYCADAFCLSKQDPETCLQDLCHTLDCYKIGVALIQEQISQSRERYRYLKTIQLQTKNTAYGETIREIDSFFTAYDLEYHAEDIPVAIDYPLLEDISFEKGSSYIIHYIDALITETELCNRFHKDKIETLLESYGEQYELRPEDLLINISELILTNAVFGMILGREADEFLMTHSDKTELSEVLKILSQEEIEARLSDAAAAMERALDIVSSAEKNIIKHIKDGILQSVSQTGIEQTINKLMTISNNCIFDIG